jgi:hypothetical protein
MSTKPDSCECDNCRWPNGLPDEEDDQMTEYRQIPADTARAIAAFIRNSPIDMFVPRADSDRWADLLDPKPPTLREQVARVLRPWAFEDVTDVADAVLAVMADELARRPLDPLTIQPGEPVPSYRQHQRNADVAWLRGEQS